MVESSTVDVAVFAAKYCKVKKKKNPRQKAYRNISFHFVFLKPAKMEAKERTVLH